MKQIGKDPLLQLVNQTGASNLNNASASSWDSELHTARGYVKVTIQPERPQDNVGQLKELAGTSGWAIPGEKTEKKWIVAQGDGKKVMINRRHLLEERKDKDGEIKLLPVLTSADSEHNRRHLLADLVEEVSSDSDSDLDSN